MEYMLPNHQFNIPASGSLRISGQGVTAIDTPHRGQLPRRGMGADSRINSDSSRPRDPGSRNLWRVSGGGGSLERTRLETEFPAIRENTGNLARFGGSNRAPSRRNACPERLSVHLPGLQARCGTGN